MKKTIFLFFLILSASTFAQGENFFAPVREGDSIYKLNSRSMKKIPTDNFSERFQSVLNRVFNEELNTEETIQTVKSEFGRSVIAHCGVKSRCQLKYTEALFKQARKEGLIDDVFLFHVFHKLNERSQEISLIDYAYKLETTQALRAENPYQEEIEFNLFNAGKGFLKREKGFGILTPRQRLFLFYSEDEIELMANTLETFLNRHFSDSSFLVFMTGEAEEKIELSSGEQYQAAVKLLNRDLKRAHVKGDLTRYPLYSDLLAAGLETGVLSNELLNEIIQLPELKDEHTSTWAKIGKIAARVGKTVLIVNPGTSLYALTAFLVIDSVKQIKEQNEKTSSDHLF